MEKTSKFITHKELAAAYNVTRQTLKKELRKIKTLSLEPMQRHYSPAQQLIIYNHLGNPFTNLFTDEP